MTLLSVFPFPIYGPGGPGGPGSPFGPSGPYDRVRSDSNYFCVKCISDSSSFNELDAFTIDSPLIH